MNSYDTACALAKEIRDSALYKDYLSAKEKAFGEEMNRNLYKQFVEISRQIQAQQFAGQAPTDQQKEQFNRLMGVLSLNADVGAFMALELRVNQMLSDVFKIIGDAVDLQLDFLKE